MIPDFAKVLSDYIHEKNVNVYSMAQFCDLDRSTMYKFINGKRRPSSISLVRKMAFFSIFIVKKAPPDEKSGGAFFAYQVINVRAFPQHVTPFFPLFHAQTSFSTPSRTAFQSTA